MFFGVFYTAHVNLYYIENLPKANVPNFDHLRTKSSPKEQKESVTQLIARLIPTHAHKFIVNIPETNLDSENPDYFEFVSTNDGSIKVTGSTGVAAAAGFYHYLKYWCFAHISWSGSHINIPIELPLVSSPIKKVFHDRYIQICNKCNVENKQFIENNFKKNFLH